MHRIIEEITLKIYFVLLKVIMDFMHSAHSFLATLPILFFTAALVSDIIYSLGKVWAFKMGHWIVFAGTLTCIPAIYTGFTIAHLYDPDDLFLEKHSVLAIFSGAIAMLYSLVRFAALRNKWIFPITIYVACSMVMMGLISWTADFGELIEKQKTVIQLKELKKYNF